MAFVLSLVAAISIKFQQLFSNLGLSVTATIAIVAANVKIMTLKVHHSAQVLSGWDRCR